MWRAVRSEVEALRAAPERALSPARLDELAGAIAEDDGVPTVTYAPGADEAVDAVRRAIENGSAQIAVLPIALAVEGSEGSLRGGDLDVLHDRLEELGAAHPEVDIQYVGPPWDDPPALDAAIAALRPAGSEEPAPLAGVVDRAFDGDLERFGRFMSALHAGVPPGTLIVLRGSAVQGVSYKTGEPFDARGTGTSDLDVVLLGDGAMAEWRPDAFYLAGVNTQPLYDEAPDVASPRLEAAREAAQEIAGRPVALQAMARWFLDLRSGLQDTPYVLAGG